MLEPARSRAIRDSRTCTVNHGTFGHGTGVFCNGRPATTAADSRPEWLRRRDTGRLPAKDMTGAR